MTGRIWMICYEVLMLARNPGIQLNDGELVWSKIPEFSIAYNGFSVIIPHVEYYLNNIMNQVREKCCEDKPDFKQELDVFIKQETFHSRFHNRFNKRMYAAGYDNLRPLVERMSADLKKFRENRSLAFNAAYCAGFESIATYDAQYLYNHCDEFFAGADAAGANLLLWHVAEEFEHRAVCHEAFKAVSGNYFIRIYGLVVAFQHIGSAFMEAEQLILVKHRENMSEEQIRASEKRARRLFWRQLVYVAPRMLKIFVPFYNPSKIKVPSRIARALEFFSNEDPIDQCFNLALDVNR